MFSNPYDTYSGITDQFHGTMCYRCSRSKKQYRNRCRWNMYHSLIIRYCNCTILTI